jgi:molybdate/tungstate transport system substrate-binding protein
MKGDASDGRRARRPARPRIARLGAALAVWTSLAGANVATARAADEPAASATPGETIAVAYGPSLERVIAQRIAPAFTEETGVRVVGEVQSSLAGLRLETRDGKPVDLVLTTDPELLNQKLRREQAPRYEVFAANAMVVAYRRDGAYAKSIAAGTPWFEALRAPGVHLGRLDPALDPLGARAVFVLQLAREYYGSANLDAQILRPEQIVPAADLIPRLRSGALDAAFAYRSQAVEADLGLLDLPIEINLADPGRRGVYERASIKIGKAVQHGGPIVLAAAVLAKSPRRAEAQRFVDFLSSAPARPLLDGEGYVVLPGFPLERSWGTAP